MHRESARRVAEAGRLRRAGDLRQSEAAAREAVEIDPDNRAAALTCLGQALSDQGRLEEAVNVYQESLLVNFNQPLVYAALARVFLSHRKPEEALPLADKACELAPGLTPTKIIRADVLEHMGREEEAFDELRLAFSKASRDREIIIALSEFVARHGLSDDMRRRGGWQECEAAAIAAFHGGCMDGRKLAAAAGEILSAKYGLQTEHGKIDSGIVERLSEDELFIRLMQECINCDPVIESFCVRLRRKLLMDYRGSEELPPAVARLTAAVALQNHLNGYVACSATKEEIILEAEEQRLGKFVKNSRTGVSGAARAALQLYAMYRPLAARQDANRLLDLPLGGEAGRLILLTVREGRDLAAEAARIEASCPSVSRAQRVPEPAVLPWLHITRPQPGLLMSFLRHRVPRFTPPEWSAGACDILYPRCGSGQEAVGTALAMPGCRISAVDANIEALAYGAHRALKLGVGNIVFSAEDAISAAAGQKYHFIDARRGNSFASLRILAGLLLPGGLLRFDVACTERSAMLRSAFEFGAQHAQGSLQAARRDILRDSGSASVFLQRRREFYDLSGCFGLIAEAEQGGAGAEELADALSQEDLLLVGQFASSALRAEYQTGRPDDPDIKDLAKYEAFMRQNSEISGGMFRLLCQRQE
ncbi:MAG: tetratricopeptide repeat protein [Proteobacteria bacterium]|nr:tetratricopeptide repeat protein [Pseudomonadota bacterium]